MRTLHTQTQLLFILSGLFLIKCFLAILFPITGDEAYFFLWSQYSSLTFYDHPPMIGWVISLFSSFSKELISIRFLAVITPLVIAFGIYRYFRSYSEIKSFYAAVALGFAPFDILHLLITNDTVLLLFSFFSLLTFLYALERTSYRFAMLSGAFFGLAFLSKYLAVIFAFGLFAGVVFTTFKSRFKLFFAAFATASIFIVFNLYANCQNCWTNIIFNLNRTSDEKINILISSVVMVTFIIYLVTPTLSYFLLKNLKAFKVQSEKFKFIGYSAVSMILFFVTLASMKTVGLHWLLFMIPLFFIVGIGVLDDNHWSKIAKHAVWIGSIHIILMSIIVMIPYEKLEKTSLYQKNIHYFYPEDIHKVIKQKSEDYFFTTTSYTSSAYLYYYTDLYFGVFGSGSHHGREDDRITDYSKLDGKNIAILATSTKKIEKFAPYFENSTLETIPIKKGKIIILWGNNFKFSKYKVDFLEPIFQRYYAKPPFLPNGECFWNKYEMEQ